MTYLNWGLLIFAIVLFFVFLYYRFRRKYTRERFIFRSSFNLFTLILLLVNSILPNSIIAELFNAVITSYINKAFTIELSNSAPFIISFLILIYAWWTLSIFKNWGDSKKPISQRQAKEKEVNARPSLQEDWQVAKQDFFKEDEQLQIYTKADEHLKDFDIATAVGESLPWEQQAAELLKLYSPQYAINEKKDWYVNEKTYISSYGKNTILIGIFCPINPPNKKEISNFIQFVENQKTNPDQDCKLVIACKKGTFVGDKTIQSKEITFVTEESLLNELINFSTYYESLRYNFEDKEITQGFPFSLQDTYTELSASIGEKDKENSIPIPSVESYIFDWVNDAKTKKHLAILAEYGQGKSVLSERIAYLITSKQIPSNRIPIIIPLRGLFLKGFSNVIDLLSFWGGTHGINPQALLKLHHAGKLLIIFEGFDETELVGDYEIRLDHFRKLWEFSIPKAKIMITGRPNFFLNDNELSTLLQTERANTGLPYCEEIYLEKFSLEKMKQALRHASPETQTEIIQILEKQSSNNNFFDLMSRPSLLFLASTVWKVRNLSKYKDNINSAIVIEEFLQHSYTRQDNKDLKTPLAVEERAYFMKGIAIGMVQKNGYTNQIDKKDFKELIGKLYENFPDAITKQLVHKNTHQKDVKNRFDQKYNKDTIFADIQSCGIIVKDLAVRNTFKFAHKSFLELLVSQLFMKAVLAKKQLKHTDEIDTNLLIKNTIEKVLKVSIPKLEKSPDTTRFTAQLIAKNSKLDTELSGKEQVKELFSSIYTRDWVPMFFVLKGIPFFGKSVLDNVYLRILFQITLITFIAIIIIVAIVPEPLSLILLISLSLLLSLAIVIETTIEIRKKGIITMLINKLFSKFKNDIDNNSSHINLLVKKIGLLTIGIEGLLISVGTLGKLVIFIGDLEQRISTLTKYTSTIFVTFLGLTLLISLGKKIREKAFNIRREIISKLVSKHIVPNRKFPAIFLDDSKEDKNNLILWFITCKELKLESVLRKILPHSAYQELEYNEALFNRNSNKLRKLMPFYIIVEDLPTPKPQ